MASNDQAPGNSDIDVTSLTEREQKLARMFGLGFPDLDDLDSNDAKARTRAVTWLRRWLDEQVEDQRGSMGDKHLHWARHRLFKQGRQWISSRDGKKWRELGNPNNRVRAVFNMIGPALNFRLSILDEQQPGFMAEPAAGAGVAGREAAEAQQAVVEHHFKRDSIWQLTRQAAANAQTDGVSFYYVYASDDDDGVAYEPMRIADDDPRYKGLVAQGYPVRNGAVEIGGDPGPRIKTEVIPAFYVWSDPEALSPNGPTRPAKWMFIRRPRDLQSARLETGDPTLQPDEDASANNEMTEALDRGTRWDKGLPPFPSQRSKRDRERIWEYILFIAHSSTLKGGRWVHIIGQHVLDHGKLPGNAIPLARLTDGSSDEDMYPRPEMSDWIGDQVGLNTVGSKIFEYGRLHSGSRLLAMKDTVITETWNNIVGSILEFRGPKPDVLQPPRANPDLWSMFNQLYRSLEDKTGWNDLGRGKVTGDSVQGMQDVSGRAVLGAREMFERQFGPMTRAAAQGVTEWAKLVVVYAQHLYKTPRLVPMVGRGDLAKALSKKHLAGPCAVNMDPETLMPLPRVMRQQMLWDMLQAGLIDQRTYAKRAPFAEIRNVHMGDTDQWNRAQWLNTVLEERAEELLDMDPVQLYGRSEGLTIWWQDDPTIHMTALEELILDERKPWATRKVAADFWGIYADLYRAKSWDPATGLPQPPAPFEVLGVPNSVPQMTEPGKQTVAADAAAGAANGVPGGQAQPTMASPMDAPLQPSAMMGTGSDGLPA